MSHCFMMTVSDKNIHFSSFAALALADLWLSRQIKSGPQQKKETEICHHWRSEKRLIIEEICTMATPFHKREESGWKQKLSLLGCSNSKPSYQTNVYIDYIGRQVCVYIFQPYSPNSKWIINLHTIAHSETVNIAFRIVFSKPFENERQNYLHKYNHPWVCVNVITFSIWLIISYMPLTYWYLLTHSSY